MGIGWIYNHGSNSAVEYSFIIWGNCIKTVSKLEVFRKNKKIKHDEVHLWTSEAYNLEFCCM